jgi:hypothetical protein
MYIHNRPLTTDRKIATSVSSFCKNEISLI